MLPLLNDFYYLSVLLHFCQHFLTWNFVHQTNCFSRIHISKASNRRISTFVSVHVSAAYSATLQIKQLETLSFSSKSFCLQHHFIKHTHFVCLFLMISVFVLQHQTELINMLDQLCGLLPSPTNATCKYFVDEYVRDFITHFHVEFDPAVVCSLLGVCSQNPVTAHGQCSLYDIALCMILVNVYTTVPWCMLVCVYYLLLCVDVHGATNSRVSRRLLESLGFLG